MTTAVAPKPAARSRGRRIAVVTGVLLLVTAATAAAALVLGEIVTDGPHAPAASGPEPGLDLTTRFLLVVVLLLVVIRCLRAVARWVAQPPVVADIVAGILLGPTVLGAAAPGFSAWLLPEQVLDGLALTAHLGLVVFMFVLGCELPTDRLRELAGTTWIVSLASLAVPFACALLLAVPLYGEHAGDGVPFLAFALFVGVALSMTALPVLASILRSRRMLDTSTGAMALTAAVGGDVVAWSALGFVLAALGSSGPADAAGALLLTALLVVLMLRVVRPVFTMLVRRCDEGRLAPDVLLALLLVGATGAALATSLIGVHAAFGAFLFGALLPRGSVRLGELGRRLESVVEALLLPFFFAHVGLQTSLGLLLGAPSGWWWALAVTTVAVVTKLLGVGGAARVCGVPPAQAWRLGVLMNCRGLTELIVANVKYSPTPGATVNDTAASPSRASIPVT